MKHVTHVQMGFFWCVCCRLRKRTTKDAMTSWISYLSDKIDMLLRKVMDGSDPAITGVPVKREKYCILYSLSMSIFTGANEEYWRSGEAREKECASVLDSLTNRTLNLANLSDGFGR